MAHPQLRRPVPPQPRSKQILIAEPDEAYREVLQRTLEVYADTDTAADFQTAYTKLRRSTPDVLIANLRLDHTGHGPQLAYVTASSGFQTRVLVYGDRAVPWITRELHRA